MKRPHTSGQRLEGGQASLQSRSAAVRVAVVEITVSFAAVLHAQLIRVARATVNAVTSVSEYSTPSDY